MNKPKILVIVIDKRTLQKYIYEEVQNFDLIYSTNQVVEFVVTDRDFARHHFPKEHYYYDLYQEQLVHIDTFDFNEIRQKYDETIRRLIEGGNSNGQEQHLERSSEK
jgi:hypothetical protein